MKILAFDTSSDTLTAGVYDSETALAEENIPGFTRHSETLAPVIRRLFAVSGVGLNDLDLIAVGIGPGSFTGLRVGLTTAKMLAFAAQKKIVSIPSLEIIAASQGLADGLLAVFLDAKKNRVYLAVYDIRQQRLSVVQKPALVSVEKLSSVLKKLKQKGCRAVSDLRPPQAYQVARIAVGLAAKKKFTPLDTLKPLYLHPKNCNVTPPPR